VVDVIIIGGGPAGSAAAIRLADIGLRVRLYEKARFPRRKLCGGFLSPESLQDLESLGVLDDLKRAGAAPVRRAVISSPSGAHAEVALQGAGLSISRERLDALLLDRARAAGVTVCEVSDGRAHEGEAEWTIYAAGRQPGPGVRYYGLQTIFENAEGVTDQVEIDLVKAGYVGLARQEDGRVNVCALTTRQSFQESGPSEDEVLAGWMAQNPLLGKRLAGANRVSSWAAVGPVCMGLHRLSEPRRLFTGDAACVVDPFAGEGLTMALRCASLLQESFSQTRWPVEAAYRRAWHQAFDRSLRFQRWTRHVLARRALHEPVVRGFQTFPGLLSWWTTQTRTPIYANH
jgi:flavin-dependent dehydrogenase